jgi:hypothetical protein
MQRKKDYSTTKIIFIPSLRKELFTFYNAFNPEREKVNFLKSEYKIFLTDEKKQILVNHFRHSKTLQPTILKLSLLRHEQICLVPDYFAFKRTFDTATKAVANFLLEKLLRISDNLSDALKQAMNELKEFDTKNTAKHMGEVRGWHVPLPVNDKTEELMFVLLLDPEKYIC